MGQIFEVESYPVALFSGLHNPLASTTYYVGANPFAPTSGGGAGYRVYIPRSGQVRWIYVMVRVAGTLGSAETGSVYLRVNNTTDYLITDQFLWNAVAFGTGLDVDMGFVYLNKNDYVELKVVTAAWPLIPPTVVGYWGAAWVEP